MLAEAGYIGDPRCGDALDLLEHGRLPDGGFPVKAKHCSLGQSLKVRRELVDWGGVSWRRCSPFVKADVRYVLRMAGMLEP